MIKVLNLTTHLNSGGITIYVLRLIDALRDRGIEYAVLSSGGEYEKYFQEKKCRTHALDIKTKNELHPKLYFALPKIIRLIEEEKYQILHAHTRITQVMAHWIQQKIGIPVITTCHGFYKQRLGRKILPAWGDLSIAISDPVALSLREDFNVDPENIRVIHNAIDLNELDHSYKSHSPASAKVSFGFTEDNKVLGVVARLVEDKGHVFLIEAYRQLEKRFPKLRLLIVGDGREYPVLQNKIQKYQLESKIILTGNIPDVPRALAAMDIFVFPATWREGFGLSIVEAMACRKPVVVTNIWALNSWIENNVTGILIEPKNSAALESSIEKLLHHPETGKTMGEKARQLVEEKFNMPRMAQQIANIYNETLTHPRLRL